MQVPIWVRLKGSKRKNNRTFHLLIAQIGSANVHLKYNLSTSFIIFYSMAYSIKGWFAGIRASIIILLFLFQPMAGFSQDANVVTFNHTIRWLNESNFPNYFLITEIRDSINNLIHKKLTQKFGIRNVAFPEIVDYNIITGFGKQKKTRSIATRLSEYEIDMFSFLTRATAGNGVFWSLNMVIRKGGDIILDKEVKHEIENANSSGYMTSLRWMSPHEFQKIFSGFINETLGSADENSDKIVVGSIEVKENEIHSWFPNAASHLLKMNGSWLNASNFAVQLQKGNDTLARGVYKNSPLLNFGTVSLKPVLSRFLTDVTGIGTTYTITEKERKRGTLEFEKREKLVLELEWFEDITFSTNSNEVQRRVTVPMVGQIFNDNISVGDFVYEKITQVLKTSKTEEKFSWASGPYTKNSFGTALIHQIRGTIHDIPFTAEYNELFGFVEIKTNNQTQAVMIFQNCNPDNLRSFNKTKISKNKLVISGGSSNIGTPSLSNETKVEWYPFLIKENATSDEMVSGIEILVCLLFGIGNM